jgi:hypothetical protein
VSDLEKCYGGDPDLQDLCETGLAFVRQHELWPWPKRNALIVGVAEARNVDCARLLQFMDQYSHDKKMTGLSCAVFQWALGQVCFLRSQDKVGWRPQPWSYRWRVFKNRVRLWLMGKS